MTFFDENEHAALFAYMESIVSETEELNCRFGEEVMEYLQKISIPAAGLPFELTVGCDIVPLGSITEKSFPFVFTESERQFLSSNLCLADTFWAVKEAAYKAGNRGEKFAPLQWKVRHLIDGSFECCGFIVKTFIINNHVIAFTICSNAAS